MSATHPFRSRFAADLAGYLALKRALGRKLFGAEKVLRHLDAFLVPCFPGARDLSVSILQSWMADSPGLLPVSRAARLYAVRQFCLYRRRTLPLAFVPDRGQHRTLWPTHVPRHVPFIFTKEQIRAVLRAALELPAGPRSSDRPRTIFALLLLLYTAGLRLSEAVGLRMGDVDFDAGTLLIRETKFFKTRLVPIACDVVRKLREIIAPGGPVAPDAPLFHHAARPYSVATIGAIGRDLLRTCGLKPACGRGGARLHDLRHAFAVHRIARWYAEGADVQSLLPALATYMGHKDIASTQYYVTITAEILEHAGRRFERACAPHEGR